MDGGTYRNFPMEVNTSKNYLGMNVSEEVSKKNDIHNFIDYILCVLRFPMEDTNKGDERVIYMKPEYNALDFGLTEREKKECIQFGYGKVKDYFNERKHTDS